MMEESELTKLKEENKAIREKLNEAEMAKNEVCKYKDVDKKLLGLGFICFCMSLFGLDIGFCFLTIS
jgi:hypothetical protein